MYDSVRTLTAAVLDAPDFHPMARHILEAFEQLAGVEATYLTRIDSAGATQHILAAHHRDDILYQPGDDHPWRDSLCAYALASGETEIMDAANRWPEAVGSATHGVRYYVCYPLQTSDGELLGTLCGLDRQSANTNTLDCQATLSLFAGLLTRALAAGDETPATRRDAPTAAVVTADMTLMDRFTELTRGADKLQAAVTDLARLELERGRWSRAVPFYCIDGQPEASWVAQSSVVSHLSAALADLEYNAETAEGGSGTLALDANLISTQRLRVEAGLAPRGTSIVLCATSPAGLQGGIVLMNEGLSPVRQGEAWLLKHCAEHLSLLATRLQTDQALAQANTQLERNATRDTLTGLRNRRYLIEELERIQAQADRLGEAIHVAFINLDGFKALNDRYGFETGDQMLVSIAQRLQRTTRASDLVARYGGDEFVVVGPGIQPSRSDYERQRLAERLRDATTGRYELPGLTLDYEGPSIGVTTSEPGDLDPDRTLALAEEAMYAVKEERRWTRAAGSAIN